MGFSECGAVFVHGNVMCVYVFLHGLTLVGLRGAITLFHFSIFIASTLREKHEEKAKQTHQA